MKPLLLAALALSLTTLSARAENPNHECKDANGARISLKPAGLGRKAISVDLQGTKIQFDNVGSPIPQLDFNTYLAVSRDGYAIEVFFSEPVAIEGTLDGSAFANILTPDGRMVTVSGFNCSQY